MNNGNIWEAEIAKTMNIIQIPRKIPAMPKLKPISGSAGKMSVWLI